MIFFGRKKSVLKTQQVNSFTCPNCEEQLGMSYTVYSKYIHIYWIPFLSYGKEKIAECHNCETHFKFKELPESLKHKLYLQTTDIKTPIWHYSGVLILGVLLCLAIYQSSKYNSKQDIYIQSPKIGDVYVTKQENSYYSAMKIERITTDSIYFSLNSQLTRKTYKIHSIDKPENYDTYHLEGWTRKELIQLISDNEITDIKRKKTK